MQFQKKIHTHIKEVNRKFLGGGGGALKAKILEAKYKAKLQFPEGRGGGETKNVRGRSIGYFLELYIVIINLFNNKLSLSAIFETLNKFHLYL